MQWYEDRIRALSKITKDTLVTVSATSTLEKKMIADKIDDCVSIINSAMTYGIVPNLFTYGHYRMRKFIESIQDDDSDSLNIDAANAINISIEGLLSDIWASKHGDKNPDKLELIRSGLYDYTNGMESFDIIKERFIPMTELPTSAQYDLEVMAAAISIVKYLLTSAALVFDAFIMQTVDDTGSYKII
jgi:hypothetical protein